MNSSAVTLNTPICGCGHFMQRKDSNIVLLVHDSQGHPYQLWRGNLSVCLNDQHEVLQFADANPFAEFWHRDWDANLRRYTGRPGTFRAIYHANPGALDATRKGAENASHAEETPAAKPPGTSDGNA